MPLLADPQSERLLGVFRFMPEEGAYEQRTSGDTLAGAVATLNRPENLRETRPGDSLGVGVLAWHIHQDLPNRGLNYVSRMIVQSWHPLRWDHLSHSWVMMPGEAPPAQIVFMLIPNEDADEHGTPGEHRAD
jgi:hypothetical protein